MFLVSFIQLYSKNKTENHIYGYKYENVALEQVVRLRLCSNVKDVKLLKVDDVHEVIVDV